MENATTAELSEIVQALPEDQQLLLLKALRVLEEEKRVEEARPTRPSACETLKVQKVNSAVHSGGSHLCFTLRDRPAIVESTENISYHGHIKAEAPACYVSFPGKYAAGWDALIKEQHDLSVACVFLCTPEDGLGQHSPSGDGRCYCHQIYGERDYKTFGYLRILPANCSEEEETRQRTKARATGMVVLREGANREEREAAELEAHRAWEQSGRTASWGCQWFHVWKEKVLAAVALKQRLKVVFFPGQVGEGREAFDDLPFADLWNGVGCGGSQKCEIAYLDLMKKGPEGHAWDYDLVDVGHFLKTEFQVGAKVDALDGKEWCRGTLVTVPSAIPKDPKETTWTVRKPSGKTFATNRVRHADLIRRMLTELGEEEFLQLVKATIPEGSQVVKGEEIVLAHGTPCFAVRLRMQHIALRQQMRNSVLSNEFEIKINRALLEKQQGQWQLQVDKTLFCEMFEEDLHRSELTEHQQERLDAIHSALSSRGAVHLSAVAGAGKTFVALRLVLDELRTKKGQVLFVAPSLGLGFHFVRWLMQSAEDIQLDVLKRIVLMHHPYDSLLSLEVHGSRLKALPVATPAQLEFALLVIDEAHEIFRPGVNREFLDKIPTHQRVLLSSRSQASSAGLNIPQVPEVKLTQVVRSSKRIVAGAAAFQSSFDKKDVTSLGPPGPPLKTFLFEVSGAEDLPEYVGYSIAALWHLMCSYAGLSFHNRLAFLVPDLEFLEKFQPALQEKLTSLFGHRHFQLTSCEESFSMLPGCPGGPGAPEGPETGETGEVVILDTVENAKGLEHLFVICVALDAKVRDWQTNLVTRSLIYQGITRAQLHALVVNRLLREGWLEFLGVVRFKEETFEKPAALAETTNAAAAWVVEQREEFRRTSKDSKLDDFGFPFSDDSPKTLAEEEHRSSPPRTARTVKSGGDTPGGMQARDSSVWDTENNEIHRPIQQLRFNPLDLAQGEAYMAVNCMEELLAAPKNSVREIKLGSDLRGEVWDPELPGHGDARVKAIAEALKVQRGVSTLRLTKSKIGPEGMEVLITRVLMVKSIKELDLTDSSLEVAGIQALAEDLRLNDCMKTLTLTNNNLGDQGAEALAEGLEVNRNLKDLFLNQCGIGFPGAEAILRACAVHPRLAAVNLQQNYLKGEGQKALHQLVQEVVKEKKHRGIRFVVHR